MLCVNKLRGKLAEKNISVTKLCDILGISPSTYYRKIQKNSFEIAEADIIVKVLELSASEASEIFFNQYVA